MILMHDIHLRTVKAVEKIIPILKEQGFELVTISEMEEIEFLRNKMKTNPWFIDSFLYNSNQFF